MTGSLAGSLSLFDQAIGTMMILVEAQAEPREAQLAVAAALFNRLDQPGRYGGTIAAICLKRMLSNEQLADPRSGLVLLRVAGMSDDHPRFLEALDVLADAAEGQDPGLGATHWHGPMGTALPYWTIGAQRTVQLNNLTFYRDVL